MQGEQNTRFYNFAYPDRPVLKISQQAQQQSKSERNPQSNKKRLLERGSSKRRMDTGA